MPRIRRKRWEFSDGKFEVADGCGLVFQYKQKMKKKGKYKYKAFFRLTTDFFYHEVMGDMFAYERWDDFQDKCKEWGSCSSVNLSTYETSLNRYVCQFERNIKEMIHNVKYCGYTDVLKQKDEDMIHSKHFYGVKNEFAVERDWYNRMDDCIFCDREHGEYLQNQNDVNKQIINNKISQKVITMLMPPIGHKTWSKDALRTLIDDEDDEECESDST